MNVNLGSGNNAVQGWLNIDKSPNVLLSRQPLLKTFLRFLGLIKPVHMTKWDRDIKFADARKLRLPEMSVKNFYSAHLLEHVFFWEAKEILRNCHMQLRPRGMIRLALPDCKIIVDNFLSSLKDNPAKAARALNESLLSYPLRKEDKPWFLLDSIIGHVHKWQPTSELVEEMLTEVGFEQIKVCEFGAGNFPDLDALEHRSEGTFYIEAHKL